MAGGGYVAAPEFAVDVETILELLPTLRQSLLSKFDDCPLSALIEVTFARGWNTHPQARGTIFHLFAAKFLAELKRQEKRTLPVGLAMAILVEACRQETDSHGFPIPPEDIVRVPLRDMKDLRMAARKFAADNEFTFERIVDVEKRLSATLTYPHPMGGLVERTLTGQIDALLSDPQVENGAVVIDWKDTYGLPPEPREKKPGAFRGQDDELRGLSYHGYFQQRFYGWLVMKNFRTVQQVTLREFYARKTKVRKATLMRSQMADVEEELSVLAQAFDLAFAAGAPPYPYGWWPKVNPATGELLAGEREFDIERLGRWKPQPGRHCGFCARSRDCPIEEDTRIEKGAPPATEERARAIAAEIQVVDQVRSVLYDAAKAWVETSGRPIPIKDGKARRVLGWVEKFNGKTGKSYGRRFELFTPDQSDRGTHALDADLRAALEQATGRAKESKPARRRRSGRA